MNGSTTSEFDRIPSQGEICFPFFVLVSTNACILLILGNRVKSLHLT